LKNRNFKNKFILIGNKNVLFNNYLLNKVDKMHDFLKTTNMTFNDFEINSNGYIQRYACNNKQLVYDIVSPVAYFRIGGGHMAISGDWKLEDTSAIKYIHLYFEK
jgi:hypothetical protein